MEKPVYTDKQIEEYLMGLFDEKEAKIIEAALVNNQALRLRVQEQKDLLLGIEAYHAKDLKEKLQRIHTKSFGNVSQEKNAKRRTIFPWLAAASIALLVIAFMWFNSSTPNTEALYAANFKPYELSLRQRDQTDKQRAILQQLYDQKKYKEAIPLFNTLMETEPSHLSLHIGAGISEMEIGNLETAREHFEAVLGSGEILYEDHAQWYLALMYLKSGDIDKTKTMLQPLINDKEADHHQEAIDLFEKLG